MTFGGVDVVAGVDLELRPGEIHAIVGENGAGKSSLAKAVSGVYQPRLGRIDLEGVEVRLRNPREALKAGVALIHQEPLAFPDLNVAESIFVGNLPRKGPLVDWRAAYSKASELLQSLGVRLDPKANVTGLSVAQRQQVELASALSHDAKVWIFDETTAALTPKEVGEMFGIMRRLRDQGCALAIVSHHLHEVFAIADRITVLRDGKKVGERLVRETNEAEIVRMMVGRELETAVGPANEPGETLLRATGLSGPGFAEVTLEVRAGEVVGLAGLVGAGRTELARALFGVTRPTGGRLEIQGATVRVRSPRHAQSLGLALVPEDRRDQGLLMPHSIGTNATLAHLRELSRRGWVNDRRVEAETRAYGSRLGLAYRGPGQAVSELSGGNQQKVVLAKWLMTGPTILILDEPTRGVDVGAKQEVHSIIRELVAQGMGVLMISSDLPEVLSMSDRILVMREGRLVAELNRHEATEEKIMFAATGQREIAVG